MIEAYSALWPLFNRQDMLPALTGQLLSQPKLREYNGLQHLGDLNIFLG